MNQNISMKVKGVLAHRIVQRAMIAVPASLSLIGGASAGEILNTTAVTGIFSDMTEIFPAIGNFVIAVLPTLLMLAIVGFVLGFFNKILGIFDKVF